MAAGVSAGWRWGERVKVKSNVSNKKRILSKNYNEFTPFLARWQRTSVGGP